MSENGNVQERHVPKISNVKYPSIKLLKRQQDELAAIKRLYELSTLPVSPDNLTAVMERILETAIALSYADMGNIQLFDERSGTLNIIVHQGFHRPFLSFFASVYPDLCGCGSSCGAAYARQQRVVVEDVNKSPIFIGTPALDIMLAAEARACQSTPLLSRDGQLVGMLNTHFRNTIQEDKLSLHFIDLLASQAADIIVQVQAQQALRESEANYRLLSEELRQHRDNLELTVAERTAELRRSERHYRTLVENIPLLITRFDTEFRYRYISPQMESQLDFDGKLLIGKTWEEAGLSAEYAQQLQKYYTTSLQTGGTVKFDTQYPDRHGEVKNFLVQIIPEINECGHIETLLTVAQDITEQKKLETELQRLDRLNTVGEMAAAIGHEVRNPLTTVHGYLQMFRQKEEFSRYQEQFATMIEELDRANGIISDFLSLAKNKAVDLKRFNLNNVISALLPLLQAEALCTGHELKIDMNDVPDFIMDEKEIRQLLLNLTRNAFEAMEPGDKLTIATNSKNGKAFLQIRDTGMGIPQNILVRLGTPFLTTKENGTGLGLAVCYRIADRHGAEIDVRTSPAGTTFTISFPA